MDNIKIGIDKIGIHIPKYYLDMRELAAARQVDPNKWLIGIGQEKMAVPDLSTDVVSMAAKAAASIITKDDKTLIDQVIIGTESGVDFSKSIATFVHQLLNIQPFCKSFEIKQACYGATAGLQMACDYVRLRPSRKVLVIATDIAKYGLNASGEPTQGAGAVAMLISKDPKILSIDTQSFMHTNSQYDFWRPNHSDYAMVDGHFSTQLYIEEYLTILKHAIQEKNETIQQLEAMVFHLPFTKMGLKALRSLPEAKIQIDNYQNWLDHFEYSRKLNQQVGNIYTGSLFLSLLSMLAYDHSLKANQKIGLFSYGSGAVSELLIGELQENYQNMINVNKVQEHLNRRQALTVEAYESIFTRELVLQDGSSEVITPIENGFYLSEIKNHQRIYHKNE